MSSSNDKNPNLPVFKFIQAGLTDTGKVRSRNEDSFTCVPQQHLWVVADGMGGHDSGDFASQTITQQAEKFIQQATLEDSILLLEENLLNSNEIIKQKAQKLGGQSTIGSTVVCLYNWNNLAFLLWAGDSRAYLCRNGELQRLTEDHSFVEELVRMGKLEANDAEQHPAANVVLNAIGIDEQLMIDMEYYRIEDQDLFILCSDGLYKDLADDRISDILQQPGKDLDETCQNLVNAALDAGGSDNCTVILVKAELETQ